MPRYLNPRSDEEAACTQAELAAYETYWDTVSTEKTLLTERYEMGMAEGEAKGKAKGKAERNFELAKIMLKDGVALEKISKWTGLTLEEIEVLADK